MKHLIADLELSKLAKQNDFKDKCLFAYDKLGMLCKDLKDQQEFDGVNYNSSGNYTSAPFYGQLTNWFREKHKLEIETHLHCGEYTCYFLKVTMNNRGKQLFQRFKKAPISGFYDHYETLNFALTEAFKIIKI